MSDGPLVLDQDHVAVRLLEADKKVKKFNISTQSQMAA
jgi:hypothetical protein